MNKINKHIKKLKSIKCISYKRYTQKVTSVALKLDRIYIVILSKSLYTYKLNLNLMTNHFIDTKNDSSELRLPIIIIYYKIYFMIYLYSYYRYLFYNY